MRTDINGNSLSNPIPNANSDNPLLNFQIEKEIAMVAASSIRRVYAQHLRTVTELDEIECRDIAYVFDLLDRIA